jgi:flagellar biosynthesis/type III secretory pathway protein FliH
MIDVNSFNKSIKRQLKIIKVEYENDKAKINEYVAFLFFRKIIDALRANQPEIQLRNSEKNPTNHFQFSEEIGNITLWASFVHINDKHEVDKNRCRIEILNSDYETIKTIL